MRFRLRSVSAVGSGMALIAGLAGLATGTSADAATTSTYHDVKVASFNLSSVSFDAQASGDHRTWRERRPVVAYQVMNQRPDVIGLQEANQSSKYVASLDYGVNQYLDLKGALAAKGGHYELTNEFAYNCLKPTSSYNCVYQNRQASQDNRIMYNADTVTMVDQGAVKYDHQTAGKNERYFVWGVFQVKATGKRFFFSNTHLDPYSEATRKAQWDEVISLTNRLHGSHPVVAVGDYNTSKFDAYAGTYLPRMKQAGYGDVLNQTYAQAVVKSPRAESMKRGWINSFNGFKPDVRSYAYEDAQQKVGNSIDWIFASNSVRVKQWSVVANVNTSTYRLQGVIPSDHAMVRATIVID